MCIIIYKAMYSSLVFFVKKKKSSLVFDEGTFNSNFIYLFEGLSMVIYDWWEICTSQLILLI